MDAIMTTSRPRNQINHDNLKSNYLRYLAIFICALTLLLGFSAKTAIAKTVDLDALLTENKPVQLGPYIEYWFDKSSKADLQAAVSRAKSGYLPFVDDSGKTQPKILAHHSGTLWLKLKISPISMTHAKTWQLVFKDHRIEKLTAYHLNRSGLLSKTLLGRTLASRQPTATAAGLAISLNPSEQNSMLFIAIESQVPVHIAPVARQSNRVRIQETTLWLHAAFFPTAIFMAWLCYIGLSRVRKRSVAGMLWTLGPILACYCWINTPLSHNFRMLGSGWTWQIALTTTPLLVGLAFLSLVKQWVDSTTTSKLQDKLLAYTPLLLLLAVLANLVLSPVHSLMMGWGLLAVITLWLSPLLQTHAAQKISKNFLIIAMLSWLPLSLLEIGLAAGIGWAYWPRNLLLGPLILISEILIFFQIEWSSLQQDEGKAKRLRQQKRSLSQTLKNLEISLEVKNRFFQKISRDLSLQIKALSALDKHQDLPDYCHKGLEQLRSLARDIQRFCEIEAGCLKLTHRPFDFKALIKSLTFTHTRLAQHKGLTFTSTQCSEIPDTLIGDPEVIAQLLSQLLDNAIRYTSSGKVDLKFQVTDAKQKNSSDDDTMVMVTIADTGPGLPGHLQQHFYGIAGSDQTEAPHHTQLGVGLTTCRHMVELMQGEIHITSLTNSGTTCYISIPLKADTNRNSQVAHKRNARPQPIKVSSVLGKAGVKVALVTTDNETLKNEITQWLSDIGYKTLAATDTELSIDLATQNAVDLFICCPRAGQPNDTEIITQIRQMSAYKKTPLVAVCAPEASSVQQQQCQDAGATSTLIQPVTEANLLTLLETLQNPPTPSSKQDAQQDVRQNTGQKAQPNAPKN